MTEFEWTPDRIAQTLASGDDLGASDVDALDTKGRTALGAVAESIGALGEGLIQVGRLIELGASIEAAYATTAERDHYLLHATSGAEWNQARTRPHYRPARFADEGFTHCSSPLQVGRTLDRLFRGRTEMLLLVIRRHDLLPGSLVWENLEGGTERFPHVYGPLPVRCVTGLVTVPARDDGSFDLSLATTRPAC